MTSDGFDAVVVGSGPNGLVGAITLAAAGQRVLVLEAQDHWGGGMRTQELTLPGFAHDVCSSVHPLALASPAFRSLRLEDSGLSWAHPMLPTAHPLAVDGREDAVLMHRSVDETAAGLGADGDQWRSWFGPLVRSSGPLVDAVLDPVHIPSAGALPVLARFGSLGLRSAAALAGHFKGQQAKALFGGNAAHSVLDLSRSPTGAFGLLLALLAQSHGWPVAVGGSQSIADALVARLRSLGGELHTGHNVTSLSELPTASTVLLDVTPRQLLAMDDGRLPNRYAHALSKYRYGPGVFKVDWALDGPVPWTVPAIAGAGTVHLGGSFAEIAAAERLVQQGGHPMHPYVLFVQASVADSSRAPAGKHTGWAYCHVPNGSTVDMTSRIEDQVERAAPGFKDLILARHVMGPAALEAHNANEVGGDIGGGAADLVQLVRRPVLSLRPWQIPVPGLFLCSSSTPPGGGVHGMCGYIAARAALRRRA